MKELSPVKIWLVQIRTNFLLLAVVLVLIGLALAYQATLIAGTTFSIFNAFLVLIGTVSAHISVNLFNEYSDYKTKIDFNTIRSPFSGGTGMLPGGHNKPGKVLFVAILTLAIAAVIGIYFTITAHWSILVISIIGALSILLYTNFFAKIMLGEFFAGFALGTLVVIGAYIAMTAVPGQAFGEILPTFVVLVSIPPGILTALLLLLNEFPDVEADKQGGRKHLVIKFGRKKSSYIYTFGLIAAFAIVIAIPLASYSTFWLYIPLLLLPLAVKAGSGAIKFADNIEKIIPVMGINVMIVLGVDLLLAVGIFVQTIL